VWDLVWVVYGLYCWRVLTSTYLDNYTYLADAFWPWINRWVQRRCAADAVSRGLLLRHLALDRLDDLGARDQSLPV
jgi:hypothetical protein